MTPFAGKNEVTVTASVLGEAIDVLESGQDHAQLPDGDVAKNLEVDVGASGNKLVDDVCAALLARQGQRGQALLPNTVSGTQTVILPAAFKMIDHRKSTC